MATAMTEWAQKFRLPAVPLCSEEVENLARGYGMRLYRTSVKEDINICNVFQHLAENYVNQVRSGGMFGFGGQVGIGGGPSSLIQIGGGQTTNGNGGFGRNNAVNRGHGNNNNGRSRRAFSTPTEYLNNPMFDSLNTHRNPRSWISDRKTITLRPLAQLTKKRSSHSHLGGGGGGNKLLLMPPAAAASANKGCRVL